MNLFKKTMRVKKMIKMEKILSFQSIIRNQVLELTAQELKCLLQMN